MQQENGAVISIRRCQSILLFNTSINKSDCCCGLLPSGTLSARMGKYEGKTNFGDRDVPAGSAGPGPHPHPLPLLWPCAWLRERLQSRSLASARPGAARRDPPPPPPPPGLSSSDSAKLTQPGGIRPIFPPHVRARDTGR